jgi:hypothetical protein
MINNLISTLIKGMPIAPAIAISHPEIATLGDSDAMSPSAPIFIGAADVIIGSMQSNEDLVFAQTMSETSINL